MEWPPTEPLSDPWWPEPGWAHTSHWKVRGGTGSIKGRASNSVESEPGKGASCCRSPELNLCCATPCPRRRLIQGEELPGLPFNLFPEETGDDPTPHVHYSGRLGSSPGTAKYSQVVFLREHRIPDDIVWNTPPLLGPWAGIRWSRVGSGPHIPCCQSHPWDGSLSTFCQEVCVCLPALRCWTVWCSIPPHGLSLETGLSALSCSRT